MPNKYTPPTFDQIIAHAKEIVLRDGFHFPTVHVIGTDNMFPIIANELGPDHESRKLVMERLG